MKRKWRKLIRKYNFLSVDSEIIDFCKNLVVCGLINIRYFDLYVTTLQHIYQLESSLSRRMFYYYSSDLRFRLFKHFEEEFKENLK